METELDNALDVMNSRTYKHIVPTRAKVSTMTFTARLNVGALERDTMQLALGMVEDDGGPLKTAYKKGTKSKAPSDFCNQFTLRHGTKSVKIFLNGSMHVTGCTSPTQFLDVASAVCTFMGDLVVDKTNDGQPVRVTAFKPVMINANFDTRTTLHLRGLCDRCVAEGYVASYDPDTYPGLNVKIPLDGERRATALVFRSGKAIITGVSTPAEMQAVHEIITRVLDEGVGADVQERVGADNEKKIRA